MGAKSVEESAVRRGARCASLPRARFGPSLWAAWWTLALVAGGAMLWVAPAGARAAVAGAAAANGPPLPGVRLRISEVMSDPLLVDDRAGEYVEVANLSACTVRLSDLALTVPSGRRLSLGGRSGGLAPGAIAVVSPQGLVSGSIALKGLRLPGRAGRLELSWRGRTVDVAQWTGRWPWPRHRAGRALERRGPETDGRSARAWRHSRQPLRGVERGSPGALPGWRVRTPAGEGSAPPCDRPGPDQPAAAGAGAGNVRVGASRGRGDGGSR